MGGDIMQSLWIGDRLSTMQKLTIHSLLAHGHPFHLYVYQDVAGVPEGVTAKNASDIVSPDEIFHRHGEYGKSTTAPFSDFFRYKLLLEKGGWWVDMDVICLRPLDFQNEHVFGYERRGEGLLTVNNAIIKAPRGSRVMEYCSDYCSKLNKLEIQWGETGPYLLDRAVQSLKMSEIVLPPEAFYPIDFWEVSRFVTDKEIPKDAYTLHLYESSWRERRLDSNAIYWRGSIYEQLKTRFIPGYSTPRSLVPSVPAIRARVERTLYPLRPLIRKLRSTYRKSS